MLGLFVAKVASMPGAKRRQVARDITGNWIEYLEGEDSTTNANWQSVGVMEIFYDEGTACFRMSAKNYDGTGALLLDLVADLRIDAWPEIKFDYEHFDIKKAKSTRGNAVFNFTRTRKTPSQHFAGHGLDLGSEKGYEIRGNRMQKDDEGKLGPDADEIVRRKRLIELWKAWFAPNDTPPPETGTRL